MNKQNKKRLFGRELKELMVCGELPTEHINEENIRTLLKYELEGVREYDTNVTDYCFDILRSNYRPADYEARKQWTYENIKKRMYSIYKARAKFERSKKRRNRVKWKIRQFREFISRIF